MKSGFRKVGQCGLFDFSSKQQLTSWTILHNLYTIWLLNKLNLVSSWIASHAWRFITKKTKLKIHPACTSDVLQTRTENFERPKNDSIALESPETSHVFRSMHLHYTAILLFFFQQSFARNLKNISPIVWYCCNIRRPYKISNILYKTNEKAVSFLSTTSVTSRDLSWVHSFFRLHAVSLFRNTERCVVVSFSGATSVQWSDVEHALCAFSGVCLDYFQVFRQFGCAKWKYCEKWHLPAPKIWNPFSYTWSSTAWRISLRQGNIL